MHNSDTGSIYSVNKEKMIYFKEWVTMLIGSNIFRDDPELLAEIEKVTGRDIDTFYDYWEASFFCTPDDYTMFDAEKNKIVSMLLEYKNKNMGDTCYRFDNEIIKGFICARIPAGDPDDSFINVFFSNCDVPDTTDIPNSFYIITFTSFSIDEVKEMLGTIEFDGSNTNQ